MLDESTFSLKELAKETGISQHAIRHYVRDGLLHATTPRGPYTRYDATHLVRLRAIAALIADGLGPRAIRNHLARATQSEIDKLAGIVVEAPPPPPPPPAPVVATPAPDFAPPAAAAAAPAPTPAVRGPELGAYRPGLARERVVCEHIEICPGVTLLVRVDADTEARRVASEIEARFAVRGIRAG